MQAAHARQQTLEARRYLLRSIYGSNRPQTAAYQAQAAIKK